MIDRFNYAEVNQILNDQVLIDQSIGEIFDNAIKSGDNKTLARILSSYPRGYLAEILGGYPDYLEEHLEDKEQ
jgi:hypothetical protein